MLRSVMVAGAAWGLALLSGLPARGQDKDAPSLRAVSFQKEVLPILTKSCGKCHTGKDAKAKLDLTSFATLGKGTKDGPAVVAGDPDKSPLVSSIRGDKPDMPKKAAPLTKAQVMTIATWVKEGAKNN